MACDAPSPDTDRMVQLAVTPWLLARRSVGDALVVLPALVVVAAAGFAATGALVAIIAAAPDRAAAAEGRRAPAGTVVGTPEHRLSALHVAG